MKKIISHVWPLTKRISSQINGTLEVTWINGKKVLDSQNANYSYGALEKVLNYGLSQIDIQNTAEILLLGLGGGSVIKSLYNRFNYKGRITAVEIDDTVIQIAKNEFDIKENKHLHIINTDALKYVKHSKTCYDLVIVDIFIDQKVPEPFYEKHFWQQLIQLLNPNANVLFNAGILLKDTTKIELLKSTFANDIYWTQYNNVEGVNTVLIGTKSNP